MTTLTFASGSTLELHAPIEEIAGSISHALRQRVLIAITGADGKALVINPMQVQHLQAS